MTTSGSILSDGKKDRNAHKSRSLAHFDVIFYVLKSFYVKSPRDKVRVDAHKPRIITFTCSC